MVGGRSSASLWRRERLVVSRKPYRGHTPPEVVGKAVAMRIVTGASYAEIGRLFDLNPGSVRNYYRGYPVSQQVAASGDCVLIARDIMEQVKKKRQLSIQRSAKHLQQFYAGDAVEIARGLTALKLGLEDANDLVVGHDDGGLMPLREDELPDDPVLLKKMVIDERHRRAIAEEAARIAGKGSAPARGVKQNTAIVLNLQQRGFAVYRSLALVGLAKSTFYDAKTKLAHPHADRWVEVAQQIAVIVEESNRCYGYRRIKAGLRAVGMSVSEKIIRRIVKRLGWQPKQKRYRPYSSYRDDGNPAGKNLVLVDKDVPLQQHPIKLSEVFLSRHERTGIVHDFHADAPNQKWFTDISEIACADGKLYLSPMIDAADGHVVSWAIGLRPDMRLVTAMLNDAFAQLTPGQQPVIHTDQGLHYRSKIWHDLLGTGQEVPTAIASMSRKGRSGDNARAEGFFGTLKTELFYARNIKPNTLTRKEAAIEITDYLNWYEQARLHAALGYKTLAEHRKLNPTTAA